MKARSGESLGINEDDIISWSYVVDGKTFHDSVKGKDKMDDLRNQILVTEGGAYDLSGVTNLAYEYYTYSTEWFPNKFGGEVHSGYGSSIINQKADTKFQIAGFTINVTDARGNVNRFANRMLAYDEINRAENKTGDLALSFQVGTESNVATKFALTDMRSVALGLKGSNDRIISISSQKDANAAITVLDNVINKVTDQQTTIGAALARLDFTATNLTTSTQNVQAAESTVRDADMARELTNYTRNNVLLQSSQAMLAQANQQPEDALGLLQ